MTKGTIVILLSGFLALAGCSVEQEYDPDWDPGGPVEDGKADAEDNVLKNAPHTSAMAVAEEWTHKYPRQQAVFPAPWTEESKFWPPVRRVDNAYGDRNLVCACLPVEAYAEEE